TKNFFVLYNSKKGPQRGLRVQGSIINDVQKAICASETPRFLYIIELAPERATKGSPIANQVVGIQNTGLSFFERFSSCSAGFKELDHNTFQYYKKKSAPTI